MHIHFLGICGTFMGSLALLARELGHTITGSDTAIYPPMSTQLQDAGITILEGYKAEHLHPNPDLIVVGNVMKRGIEAVEYMLDNRLDYVSAPQFLAEHILKNRHILAVAGTHGKTTTTTMLAWILHYAGIDTGFLIGGVPLVNTDDGRLKTVFKHSAYLGKDTGDKDGYFVIEADEYDSAFFDKRSKFVHYRPTTAILNNLEFDHADIFADLGAIQTQFHHMIRTIPSNGKIIMPANTPSLEQTIDKGFWTPIWRTSVGDDCADFTAQLISDDGTHFIITHYTDNKPADTGTVHWQLSGTHSVNNALVAVAAAFNVGVNIQTACQALSNFAGIKRRMEKIGQITKNNKTLEIYDDFAHHPTAITLTLDGARKKIGNRKIWAVIEPRSNTMKLGVYQDKLAMSASIADKVIWYAPKNLDWSVKNAIGNAKNQTVMDSTDDIIAHIKDNVGDDDVIIIMSNGGFEGIHTRLVNTLQENL